MIKASQTCYLEKHRIYEMFRNVVKALVMIQPPDPLRFVARYLKRRRHADVPKILLVAPPDHRLDTDKVYVALNIAKSTGVVTIDRRNVLNRHRKKRSDDDDGCVSTDFMTMLTEYMRAKGASTKGWILLDIPNSDKEADMMISLGILPTHTIVLNETAAAVHNTKIKTNKFNLSYKNLEFEIKMKFRFTLKEINVQSKSIDEITELCLDQILCQKPSDVPFVPRVTIIGPNGSEYFVVASALSKRFNLVYVDFDQMLDQKGVTSEKIAEETAHSWLKEKLTEDDCVENGYVIKGFPRTRADFEWLDSTEMAPNRVIFLAISFPELYGRYKNRCLVKNTGTTLSLDRALDELKAGTLKFEHLSLYPSNSGKFLCEFKSYCKRLKEMLYYCGDSCSIIPFGESLCDKVYACVVSASPAAGPRPRDRMPSRLTPSLAERMFLPSGYEDVCRDPGLSEAARDLLNALDRDAKRLDNRGS